MTDFHQSALVLFSGGQDSTTCLAYALKRYPRVETLGFDYGQRHRVEMQARMEVLDRITEVMPQARDRLGQDHVLERIRENLLFLEDPESIERHGGYVPGGILLWAPPGTGKTLMAEAMAGETGKPFIFVDPGAFNNMFFGVGVMKVKSLFRKLRKLAVRYGGVIVFFDEADTLGSRGGQVSQASPRIVGSSPADCNGRRCFYHQPFLRCSSAGLQGAFGKPAYGGRPYSCFNREYR